MLRASVWQWDRHIEKKEYISEVGKRLEAPIMELTGVTESSDWPGLHYHRLKISGEYNFEDEIVIANRSYDKQPGKHVITPMLIDGTNQYILVNRGFVPVDYSQEEKRKAFQTPQKEIITGLAKPSVQRKFFLQPADPSPVAGKKFDSWLRVDIEKLSIQMQKNLLPIYVEKMENENLTGDNLVKQGSDKAQMLVMPGASDRVAMPGLKKDLTYPVPDPDQVISAGRHLGYVYEWAFMALLTGLIGLVLQLKRY